MMNGPTPLLEIRDLHVRFKIYEGELQVLNGVDLRIGEGEKVGLVGEAGCGKTTTIKSVLRVLPTPPAKITQGQILYKGKDILKMRRSEIPSLRRGEISAIFQDPLTSLNPVFTIGQQLGDIIKYSLKNQGIKKVTREKMRFHAASLLKETGMPDPERILKSYPVQLSGGMRQRVCISEALRMNVNLLMADEPTTNLDVTIQDQILRRLDELVEKRGTSILLITHSLGVVRNLTHRVYIMYAGNIIEASETGELFRNPLHPYTRGLLKTVPRLTGEGVSKGIPGRIPNYLNPPMGCRYHPRCEQRMPVCMESRPPMYLMQDDRNAKADHRVACYLYRSPAA
jgi:peptide/nickel transport system ATP-binding protein